MPRLDVQHDIPGWLLDEAVSPATKLRQGDLIVFENQDNALRRAGIVVTADCDLEQKKHARLVTLIPVVTAKIILERYLILEDCERKRQMIEDYAFKACTIDGRQDRETKLSLLKAHAQREQTDINELSLVASHFALDKSDFMTIGSYKKLMQAIQSGPKNAEKLTEQIRKRGDLFILPDTQELGIAGGIAWIRHIWQVPLTDIAIRTSEVSSRPGERIARLDSPYRYRLTQLMAQVFSDIGLPAANDQISQLIEEAYSNA